MGIETNLTALPERFNAGTTVTYLRSVDSGYGPGDGWTLTLYIAGISTASAAGSDEGGSYRITLAATDTAQLEAGRYQWVERLSKAGEVIDYASGVVIVDPDIAAAGAGELLSEAEKLLPLVEAALEKRIPAGYEGYMVYGRRLDAIPIRDLEALRSSLRSQVNRLRNPGKLGRVHKVYFPTVDD